MSVPVESIASIESGATAVEKHILSYLHFKLWQVQIQKMEGEGEVQNMEKNFSVLHKTNKAVM